MHCACEVDNVKAFRYRNACFHSAINLYAFAIGSANLNSSPYGNYIDSVSSNALYATNAFCY